MGIQKEQHSYLYQNSVEEIILEDWVDAYISETKKRGYVATLDLSMIKNKFGFHKFWGLNDKAQLIELTNGSRSPLTNLFLSLNAFEPNSKGELKRRVSNLAQIRNIGIDLDCYKLGLTPVETLEVLKKKIFSGEIPNPNLVILSGNGVQLIYGLAAGVAPTERMKWLAIYITNQLSERLLHLGADFAANTLERVFRLPGTYNVKPDKPKKLVQVEMWRQLEYGINELYEYCAPYEAKKYPKKRQKQKGELRALPLLKSQGGTLRALNTARLNDFLKLVELRNGNIENRNVLTYDYAFTLTLTGASKEAVFAAAIQVNQMLTDPQEHKIIERTASSAFKDATVYWKAFKENDYKQFGLRSSLIKPKKNSTLIKHHSITAQEQADLSTLIGSEEHYSRKVEKRRKKGVKTREEYLKECTSKTTDKLEKLREVIEVNPEASQRKLSELMGIGKSTLNRLYKQL